MSFGPIPAVLTDFRAYNGRDVLLGTTEVSLPAMPYLTAELAGAGISGKMSYPTAMTDNITMSITWRTHTKEAFALSMPGAHDVTFRGNIEVFEPATGLRINQPLRVVTRVMPTNPQGGSLKPGEPTDQQCEFTVIYVKYELNGKVVYELDKFNYILRYLGLDGQLVDAYQALRDNLGV